MNWLQPYYAHLAGYVRSMTPGSRIVAGLLLLLIAAGAFCLHVFPPAEANESLLGEQALAADELSRIQLALADAGMTCEVANSRVLVPRGRRAEYMAVLRRAGALPSGRLDAMDKVLQNDSLLTPPEQRKAMYNLAKAKTLEAEIAAFAGVADARVTLDSVEQRRLGRNETLHAATVVVTMKPGERLTTNLGAMICDHVAGSVAGMRAADVTVSDNVNLIRYRGVCDDRRSSDAEPFANREVLEQEYQEKIRGLLRDFLPDAQVVVRIQSTASFFGGSERGAELPATPRQVNREDTEAFRGEDAAGPTSAMTANRPRELPQVQDLDACPGEDDPVGETFIPTAAPRVVIRVPHRYFENLWSQWKQGSDAGSRQTAATFQRREVETRAIRQIQQLAASALPPVEGIGDSARLVTVVRLPDNPMPEENPLQPDETPDVSVSSTKPLLGAALFAVAATGYVAFRSRSARRGAGTDSSYVVTHARYSGRAASRVYEDSAGIELDDRLARRLASRRNATSAEPAATPSHGDVAEIDDVFFEELMRLDGATVADVGESAGPEIVALALIGAPPVVVDHLLGEISAVHAAAIRRAMDHCGPTRLSDVDAARRQLLERIAPLDERADSSRTKAVAVGESMD